MPGDPEPLPRLRDMADAFLVAGPTSNEAVHLSAHTRAQRTPTWPVTQAAADKALPSTAPTHRTHVKDNPQTPKPPPLLRWAEDEAGTSAGAHARTTLQVHKHTHLCRSLDYQHGPSACPAPHLDPGPPDPPHRVPDFPAGPAWCSLQKHAALADLSLMRSAFTSPPGHTCTDPLHGGPCPGP